MATYLYKRLLAVVALSGLIAICVILTGQALAGENSAVQTKTLDRNHDPVVVKGATLVVNAHSLTHTQISDLFVYVYTGSTWVQIPFQIDEVTSGGDYIAAGDGELNVQDEIVFMAQDLGDQAPVEALISAMLPISPTWFELEVTDPTAPTKKGWAYVVGSKTLSQTFTADYVGYISPTITASQYELGLAAGYPGFEDLSLNGSGVDILDRTKLRVVVDLGLLFTLTLNEDDLTDLDLAPIKDGPVRVILQQSAVLTQPGVGNASVDSTFMAYPAMIQGVADTVYMLSLGTISSTRTSIDLSSDASGATFYNASTPAGVTVDAGPDAVPGTLSTWSQISHTSGRVVQVTDPSEVGGTQTTYYCDGAGECDGTPVTGDGTAYGDSGFLFSGSVNNSSTVTNTLYILPAAGGENVGLTYQGYFDNPLTVVAHLPPVADVVIDKRFIPPLDGVITYSLTFINNGPDIATGVVITDVVPTGLSGLAVTNSGVPLIRTPGITYAWTVSGTLPVDQGGLITITGQYQPGDTYNNTAIIQAAQDDDNPANNTDSATVNTALGTADVAISKVAAAEKGIITYTLSFTNNGPDIASSVVISDIIPGGITNLSVITSGVPLSEIPGNTFAWTVSGLWPAQQTGLITISGQYEVGRIYTNTATINAGQNDSNDNNNTATAVVDAIVRIYLPIVFK